MTKLRTALVLLCFALFAAAAMPQTPAPTAKHQKVVTLIKLTGAPDLMVTTIQTEIAKAKKTLPLPPEAQNDFESEFLKQIKADDLVDLLVPTYEKYYTEAEIDQLIVFYGSPIGKKMVASMPVMTEELTRASAELGGKIGAQVGQKIEANLRAGKYGAWPPDQKPSN